MADSVVKRSYSYDNSSGTASVLFYKNVLGAPIYANGYAESTSETNNLQTSVPPTKTGTITWDNTNKRMTFAGGLSNNHLALTANATNSHTTLIEVITPATLSAGTLVHNNNGTIPVNISLTQSGTSFFFRANLGNTHRQTTAVITSGNTYRLCFAVSRSGNTYTGQFFLNETKQGADLSFTNTGTVGYSTFQIGAASLPFSVGRVALVARALSAGEMGSFWDISNLNNYYNQVHDLIAGELASSASDYNRTINQVLTAVAATETHLTLGAETTTNNGAIKTRTFTCGSNVKFLIANRGRIVDNSAGYRIWVFNSTITGGSIYFQLASGFTRTDESAYCELNHDNGNIKFEYNKRIIRGASIRPTDLGAANPAQLYAGLFYGQGEVQISNLEIYFDVTDNVTNRFDLDAVGNVSGSWTDSRIFFQNDVSNSFPHWQNSAMSVARVGISYSDINLSNPFEFSATLLSTQETSYDVGGANAVIINPQNFYYLSASSTPNLLLFFRRLVGSNYNQKQVDRTNIVLRGAEANVSGYEFGTVINATPTAYVQYYFENSKKDLSVRAQNVTYVGAGAQFFEYRTSAFTFTNTIGTSYSNSYIIINRKAASGITGIATAGSNWANRLLNVTEPLMQNWWVIDATGTFDTPLAFGHRIDSALTATLAEMNKLASTNGYDVYAGVAGIDTQKYEYTDLDGNTVTTDLQLPSRSVVANMSSFYTLPTSTVLGRVSYNAAETTITVTGNLTSDEFASAIAYRLQQLVAGARASTKATEVNTQAKLNTKLDEILTKDTNMRIWAVSGGEFEIKGYSVVVNSGVTISEGTHITSLLLSGSGVTLTETGTVAIPYADSAKPYVNYQYNGLVGTNYRINIYKKTSSSGNGTFTLLHTNTATISGFINNTTASIGSGNSIAVNDNLRFVISGRDEAGNFYNDVRDFSISSDLVDISITPTAIRYNRTATTSGQTVTPTIVSDKLRLSFNSNADLGNNYGGVGRVIVEGISANATFNDFIVKYAGGTIVNSRLPFINSTGASGWLQADSDYVDVRKGSSATNASIHIGYIENTKSSGTPENFTDSSTVQIDNSVTNSATVTDTQRNFDKVDEVQQLLIRLVSKFDDVANSSLRKTVDIAELIMGTATNGARGYAQTGNSPLYGNIVNEGTSTQNRTFASELDSDRIDTLVIERLTNNLRITLDFDNRTNHSDSDSTSIRLSNGDDEIVLYMNDDDLSYTVATALYEWELDDVSDNSWLFTLADNSRVKVEVQRSIIEQVEASVSPLATATNLATVDTVVDAIKAKTDNLTFNADNEVATQASSLSESELHTALDNYSNKSDYQANVSPLATASALASLQTDVDTMINNHTETLYMHYGSNSGNTLKGFNSSFGQLREGTNASSTIDTTLTILGDIGINSFTFSQVTQNSNNYIRIEVQFDADVEFYVSEGLEVVVSTTSGNLSQARLQFSSNTLSSNRTFRIDILQSLATFLFSQSDDAVLSLAFELQAKSLQYKTYIDALAIRSQTTNLATASALTLVDTVVDAIKAKTDNLNFNSDSTTKVLADSGNTGGGAGSGLSESDFHNYLDSYTNKASWKAGVASLATISGTTNIQNTVNSIKTKTDRLHFGSETRDTDDAVQVTLDGEEVTTNSASRTASQANVTGLATASALATLDTVADAIKLQTDKLAFASNNDIKATLDGEQVTTDSASRTASKATGFATATALATVDALIDAIKAKTDNLNFNDDGTPKVLADSGTTGGTLTQALFSTYLDNYGNKNNWKADVSALATQALLTSIKTVVDTLPTTVASASSIATAVRTNLATELARIDADVSSRLATSGYTNPRNDLITAIKAVTDTLVVSGGKIAASLSDNVTVGGFGNNVLNSALDTYTNKDDWKADVSALTTILAKINPLSFTSNRVNAQVLNDVDINDTVTLTQLKTLIDALQGTVNNIKTVTDEIDDNPQLISLGEVN